MTGEDTVVQQTEVLGPDHEDAEAPPHLHGEVQGAPADTTTELQALHAIPAAHADDAPLPDMWDDGTSNAGSEDEAGRDLDAEEGGIDLAIWWQMVEDWEEEVAAWCGRVDDLGEHVQALRQSLQDIEGADDHRDVQDTIQGGD